MKIKTIYSYKNAYKARGLTVVIDVLRAFSTACFVINNGAKKIISHLEKHPSSQGFLKKGLSKFAKKDFYLCLDLDRFDSVLKAKKNKNDLIYLKK